jgi:hypothetical protein
MTLPPLPCAERRFAFATALLIAAFALVAGCDRPFDPPPRPTRELPLPPNLKFSMQASEFQANVATNEMGFRGGPVSPPAPGRIRIVTLGDEATFGWGVDVGEAWPARLETELREKGIDAEVLNLGSPGAGPSQYAAIAERMLPALKPQVVLVGLVQGIDLVRAADPGHGKQVPLGPGKTFRDTVQAEIAAFTPQERERVAALDPKVRMLFETGGLDPALVALAVRRPGYFLEPVEKSAAELEPNRKAVAVALERVKAAAGGARTIAVGVPHPFYVSGSAQQKLGEIGFRTHRSGLDSFQPNALLRAAVVEAGFDAERIRGPAVAFRVRSVRPRTPRLFFHWDDGFNAKGHEAFAKQVVRMMRRQIRLIPKE